MTTAPAPLPALLDDLRALLAEERRAIARLDATAIRDLAERRRDLLTDLTATLAAHARPDPALTRLVTDARIELAVNAALIAAASEAVSASLGVVPTDTYDRSARALATTRSLRVVAG